ncbi:MAG: hypothetical protein RLY65_940 [Pseudomonadota bacterium]|jgi:hypothetical protein
MNPVEIEDVASRFLHARRTARRLPRAGVQGFYNVWPAFARTEFERLAADNKPMLRFYPTPRDIDEMLEAMRWIQWLPEATRHLVWMRADRHDWVSIGKRFGCSGKTAWRHWRYAMMHIAMQVNQEHQHQQLQHQGGALRLKA